MLRPPRCASRNNNSNNPTQPSSSTAQHAMWMAHPQYPGNRAPPPLPRAHAPSPRPTTRRSRPTSRLRHPTRGPRAPGTRPPMFAFLNAPGACHVPGLPDERCRPMSREPALEVGGCPLTRHRPQVRRVTHTHTLHVHVHLRRNMAAIEPEQPHYTSSQPTALYRTHSSSPRLAHHSSLRSRVSPRRRGLALVGRSPL